MKIFPLEHLLIVLLIVLQGQSKDLNMDWARRRKERALVLEWLDTAL